jgi:hypothetical protein
MARSVNPQHPSSDAAFPTNETHLLKKICASIRQAAIRDLDAMLAIANAPVTDTSDRSVETARLALWQANLVQREIEIFLAVYRRPRHPHPM